MFPEKEPLKSFLILFPHHHVFKRIIDLCRGNCATGWTIYTDNEYTIRITYMDEYSVEKEGVQFFFDSLSELVTFVASMHDLEDSPEDKIYSLMTEVEALYNYIERMRNITMSGGGWTALKCGKQP